MNIRVFTKVDVIVNHSVSGSASDSPQCFGAISAKSTRWQCCSSLFYTHTDSSIQEEPLNAQYCAKVFMSLFPRSQIFL